ncbi:MAG: VanW family protein, partial [Clostridia bacterium]|nr:VanW family protein [Clostridia bacterium]
MEVEGVSLQGKTEREAREALSPLFSAWEKRTLTLLLPDGTGVSVSAPQIAVKTDFDRVFSSALQVKKGESATLSLTPIFSLVNFSALTKEIANRFYLAPVNANLTFTPNETPLFSVSKEKQGRMVDEYALVKRVIAALPRLKEQETVSISVPLKTLAPTLTKRELEGRHERLSTFSTAYPTSQAERKHNIALAVEKLHGVTLAPGETLSFNARVGERTEENGFLKAK